MEGAAGALASRRRAESDRLLNEGLLTGTLLPLAVSAALLLMGSIMLWLALRPVTRLALAARRLAAGGEPVIPYVRRQDEAGAVARALLGYREAVASQRAITQHTPVGMLTLGLNLEVRNPNPALTHLFGYDYEDWKTNAARYVGMVTHPDDIAATGKLYQRLMAGESDHLKLEKRYVRKDGSIFWGSYTVTIVRDLEGRPAFYVGMIENVNDRKEKLARAAKAQRDLLPDTTLDVPGYDLAGLCRPTEEVGGDFYDWYQPDPRSLVLTLGDVMGKGMPAAILMATMRIALRSSDWLPSVSEVVDSVAESTERDLGKAESFMTLFHARLDLETGLVTYVDAGHGLLMVVGADGAVRPPHSHSPPLGVLAGQRYAQFSLTLRPGEALVVFSDGVLDVHPDVQETAGALLAGATSAQEMAERLATNPESTITDDVTVVVLRRQGR
jgi:PAS domain S-box-containing protein